MPLPYSSVLSKLPHKLKFTNSLLTNSVSRCILTVLAQLIHFIHEEGTPWYT